MKTLKRIISFIIIIALFTASFLGSFSYFSRGTFAFDPEKLAVFDESTDCFFLRAAPADIKFQIELDESQEHVSYSLTDSLGNMVKSRCEKVSGKVYNIVPPSEGYISGEQYTLTLGTDILFTDDNLRNARILVFTIERENIEEYKFTENVIQTDTVIKEIADGVISLKDMTAKAQDILLGKNEKGKYVVYKITKINKNGTANVRIPAADEIYDEINVYGEYEFDIKQIVDNPDLDIKMAENVKESGFFSALIKTAYAAEKYDKTKIAVSKTPDYDNNAIEIKIVITLEAGENGLFGIEELRDHDVSLTLKVKEGLRVNANIQSGKNWDISGTISTKTSWQVEIERERRIVEKETALEDLFADKEEYSSYDEYYHYKQYQNNVKTIIDKLNQITADANSGEIKLFDWNLPVPSVPGLYFSAEVKLFVDFTLAASVVIGQENSTVYTIGVCYINKKFNAYSNTYKSGEDISLSLRGKMKLKAGIKLSIMAVLICDEVAYVELDPQVGLYSEVFAIIPILGNDDITEKKFMYSYFEPGVYFQADIKAKVNLLVKKYEFIKELVEMKYPINAWTLGNDKIAMGLVVNGNTVRVIDNAVKLPDIYFEYYDVKSGINGTERIPYDKLKFISSEGTVLEVEDGELILPAATSSGSCYITATYLHTDGNTYSTVFRVLISGSMIEGKVSAYQSDMETASLEGAEVSLYSINNASAPISKQKTDINGKFSFNVSEGEYRMVISADGYQTLTSTQKVEKDEIKYAEHILLIDNEQRGIGSAAGTLTDALNGRGISGAKLKLRREWNNKTDPYVEGVNIETDGSGYYFIKNVPVGYYTLEASLQGYVTGYTNIIVLSSNPKTDFDFSITPLLAEDEIRIVLTWGEDPFDLDSHLIGRTPDNNTFNVYYSSKNYYYGGIEMANLDVDDTTSYGPETVTILEDIYGTYTYAVHDYSHKDSNDSNALSLSGAVVRVFVGSKQIGEYHVPTDQVGTYWTVFKISGSGRIVPINSVSNIKPAA